MEASTETGEKNGEEILTADLFLIKNNDMQSECLILEQMVSGKQYMYYYSIATRFLDKYGNRAGVSEFEPGRVVTIGKKNHQGKVMQVQISDRVWEYPEITGFSVDEERGVFEIAGTKYSYAEDVYVNSDGNPERLEDLTDMDVLRVVGIGKKILSVSVTTGHGELQLTNTGVFEGSYIQVGSRIFSEITRDMTMELPEGIYTVAVANDGYGGSTEIEVKRGQKVTLDLDTLKGDGPKYGSILFAIDVAGAVLQIDGKVVDYSEAVPLQYGVHSLTVTADSYETYSKKLYVNSNEATIVIGLTGEPTASSETADAQTGDSESSQGEDAGTGQTGQTSSEGLAGSLAGSHSTGGSTLGSSSSGSELDEAELNALVNDILDKDKDNSTSDYLSTLTELLSSLTGKSGS